MLFVDRLIESGQGRAMPERKAALEAATAPLDAVRILSTPFSVTSSEAIAPECRRPPSVRGHRRVGSAATGKHPSFQPGFVRIADARRSFVHRGRRLCLATEENLGASAAFAMSRSLGSGRRQRARFGRAVRRRGDAITVDPSGLFSGPPDLVSGIVLLGAGPETTTVTFVWTSP